MDCRHKILLKNGNIVPCGKCPACLANNRQELVFRLREEYKSSAFGLFVTLTYDDDHLPADHSVNKEDMQLFHKRLRKHFEPGELRYFVTSEYGDHTFRPHYHGLYFFKSTPGSDIYKIFENAWKNGFVQFGQIEEGSIVYCTKYCLKKTPTPPGCKPTFRLFSKMAGGLGSGYLEKMSDYHTKFENYEYVSADGKRCRMPKYYRTKLRNTRGSSKYNPLYVVHANDYLKNQYEDNARQFRLFINEKHFDNFDAAVLAFEEYQNKKRENRDELLIKHCKKQKM